MSLSPSAVTALRRITTDRPRSSPGERCEMCAEPVADQHQHVVDVDSRALMCTCRPCYLLFSQPDARLRYRSVPDRYLSFPDFALAPGQWDALQIPVGLAFLFRNSVQDRSVVFYPGPAGATESELDLDAWQPILEANPALQELSADIEALLVRVPQRGGEPSCHLVPIDVCYELVGRLRQVWRGFDGGSDARAELDAFFETVRARSRPAPTAPAEAEPRP